MKGIRIAALVAAATLALGVAACGGDDDSTSAETPTKEEFIAEANQICADGNAEVESQAQEIFGNGQPSQEEVENFVTETAIPSTEDQVNQIRDLGAPEGDEDEVNAILDSAQSDIDAVKEDPSLLTEGDGADDPFADTNKLAAAYGLTECAG